MSLVRVFDLAHSTGFCSTQTSDARTTMSQDSDPIVASYNVFHEPSKTLSPASASSTAKTMVLQYPAHRSASKPYDSYRSQKPRSMKYKPKTGLVELEIPIITSDHYNVDSGARFGKALSDSRTVQKGGTHGLAGGFSSTPAQPTSLRNIPNHDESPNNDPSLTSQKLGGKVAKPTERDPIYFLGVLQGDSIHMSQLEGVVQLRPQLPYIDAEEEVQRHRQMLGNAAAARDKTGLDVPAKMESKAVELKLKDTKEDARDRSLNENTKALREIQIEQWQAHDWIDDDDEALQPDAGVHFHFPTVRNHNDVPTATDAQLRSALNNGDWLDKMSAPREDGKKGLLAKLRGRERERARRKKAEEEKKSKASAGAPSAPVPASGPMLEQSSDSDLTSPEASDMEDPTIVIDDDVDAPMKDVEIKEEPEIDVGAAEKGPSRRTARSRKLHQTSAIDEDD